MVHYCKNTVCTLNHDLFFSQSTRDFWMFFGFWPSVKRTTIDTLWLHDHPLSDFFLPECECKWIATLLSILKRIQYYSWTTALDSSLWKKIMKIFKTEFFWNPFFKVLDSRSIRNTKHKKRPTICTELGQLKFTYITVLT